MSHVVAVTRLSAGSQDPIGRIAKRSYDPKANARSRHQSAFANRRRIAPRDCLAPLMVPRACEMREWDYGASGERFVCWVVPEHQASNTCIAYCEHGFGPADPWGLPPLSIPSQALALTALGSRDLRMHSGSPAAWSGPTSISVVSTSRSLSIEVPSPLPEGR